MGKRAVRWLAAPLIWVLASIGATGATELVLPDPKLTPGLTRALSLKEICSTRWGRDARKVSSAMKRRVYASYGLTGETDAACVRDAAGRTCEVDHLIPRSLGGADNVKNLWPQPFGTEPWNAARKDKLEAKLSRDVCAGRITLENARNELLHDYRTAYRRYYGNPVKVLLDGPLKL